MLITAVVDAAAAAVTVTREPGRIHGPVAKTKGKLVDQVRPDDEGDGAMERAMSGERRQLITGSRWELGCV